VDEKKSPNLALIIRASSMCRMDRSKLYDFYGKLSGDIHGQPWNGPSLILIRNLYEETEYCFIKMIGEATSLIVEEL